MSELSNGIGKRLKEQRRAMKLTQKDMAELIGVTVTYISEVERDKKRLSLEKIMRFHSVADNDLLYLLTGVRSTTKSVSGFFIECPDAILEEVKLLVTGVVDIYNKGRR